MRRAKRIGWLLAAMALLASPACTDRYVSGTVVDAGDSTPVARADVRVRNRGWGRISGQLVWDKDYDFRATTDAGGHFRISYDVGSSAHLIVRIAGYEDYDAWLDAGSDIVVRLVRVKPQPAAGAAP